MEKQKIIKGVYSANDILGEHFGLYQNEYVNVKNTQADFVRYIKSLRPEINKILKDAGLELTKVKAYSPAMYNFQDDDLDLHIYLRSKTKYLNYIRKHRDDLNKLMAQNVSYDGYIAKTVRCVDEEIGEIMANHDPDILVIRYMLHDWFNANEEHIDALYECIDENEEFNDTDF